MSTMPYASIALPLVFGLVYLFGVIRIHRHEPRLGMLSLLFPVGLYAMVRYWSAEKDNPRVPMLVALVLLCTWIGLLAWGTTHESPKRFAGAFTESGAPAGDDALDDRMRLKVAYAGLPYRAGTIALPQAQARIDLPSHFRFVSSEALRGAGIEVDDVPHAAALGWIVHESVDLASDTAWYIDLDWFGEGFVSADRLAVYGNDALLAEARATAQRLSGLDDTPEFELARFAETPVYNVSDALLTWAEDIRYADEGATTRNCHAIKLGRAGALQFSIQDMAPARQELCLRAVRLVAGSSRFLEGRAYADYSRLFDKKSRFDLVDLVTGRHRLRDL
ncbi:MAG: DUF2167 domain-containing protein [Lysobacteraceae bacterium]|nr:MAG: DUF2167 domain-containing protein [Xanthomonadaceae bacterium]